MSNIEWTGETWNPILGCSKISPGCDRCYAIDQAYRNWEMAKALPEDKRGRLAYYEGLTKISRDKRRQWTGKLTFVPEALEIPLKRKKPQTYFVNSMSDLFHEKAKSNWVDEIFDVMQRTPQHTYQILTKRTDRMNSYCRMRSPLPNVWLGATVENQDASDIRGYDMADLKHRFGWNTFYSVEPILEKIDLFSAYAVSPVSWVIVGGESGFESRPCHIEWMLDIVEQCQMNKVPVFVKQLGANPFQEVVSIKHLLDKKDKKGGDINSFPSKLQIRQFPQR
jgi:protein gp37